MTARIGYIALTARIKVDDRWFEIKDRYAYYSKSVQEISCYCNGELEPGYIDHYEVIVDEVSYYIPAIYAVVVKSTTSLNTQTPMESFMDNWTDKTKNYYQAYKDRLGIDIAHGAFAVNVEEKEPALNYGPTDSDESSSD